MTHLIRYLRAVWLAVLMFSFASVTFAATVAPSRNEVGGTACKSQDDWSEPTKPRPIYGNTWYVGTCAISVVLIKGPEGYVLIDGAVEEAVPNIEANIRALGVHLRDIKYIMVSHEHIDHVGGVALLQKHTGATVVSRRRTARSLLSGKNSPDDPQADTLTDFTPIGALREISDGASVTLAGKKMTNIPMPGHAPGGQGWSWMECEKGKCLKLIFADSVTSISNDEYKFGAAGSLKAALLATTVRLAGMRCEILITGHVKHSNLLARLDGFAPLIDSNACKNLAMKGKADLATRLKKEAASKP